MNPETKIKNAGKMNIAVLHEEDDGLPLFSVKNKSLFHEKAAIQTDQFAPEGNHTDRKNNRTTGTEVSQEQNAEAGKELPVIISDSPGIAENTDNTVASIPFLREQKNTVLNDRDSREQEKPVIDSVFSEQERLVIDKESPEQEKPVIDSVFSEQERLVIDKESPEQEKTVINAGSSAHETFITVTAAKEHENIISVPSEPARENALMSALAFQERESVITLPEKEVHENIISVPPEAIPENNLMSTSTFQEWEKITAVPEKERHESIISVSSEAMPENNLMSTSTFQERERITAIPEARGYKYMAPAPEVNGYENTASETADMIVSQQNINPLERGASAVIRNEFGMSPAYKIPTEDGVQTLMLEQFSPEQEDVHSAPRIMFETEKERSTEQSEVPLNNSNVSGVSPVTGNPLFHLDEGGKIAASGSEIMQRGPVNEKRLAVDQDLIVAKDLATFSEQTLLPELTKVNEPGHAEEFSGVNWGEELLVLLPELQELTDRGNFVTGRAPGDFPELHEILGKLTETTDQLERINSVIEKFEQEYRT